MNTYELKNVNAFKKVNEEWGQFSNMAAFPLNVAGINIKTSEALYQALRYPHIPHLQNIIIQQASPMAAKMKSKPRRKTKTSDLFNINQLEIMEWCVRVKVAQHYLKFKPLLKKAVYVVENSHKDRFWGAVPTKENPNILIGENKLGKIWNKIIQEFQINPTSIKTVNSLNIKNITLLNKNI